MQKQLCLRRVSVQLDEALREIAHRRRISKEQLLRDTLHKLAVDEGFTLCPYCEPGAIGCPGMGVCHCGCGKPCDAGAKYLADHHSLPFLQPR